MQRRELLSSVAAGGSLILGGCTTSNLGKVAPNTKISETESDRRSTSTALKGFEIGERMENVNPHSIVIVNKGEETQIIELSISAPVRNETLLEYTYSLSPGKKVRGKLWDPAYYNIRIHLPEVGKFHKKSINIFDYCNSYGTNIRIQSKENITSTTTSTTAGCNSPEFPTPNTTKTE